MPKKKSKFLQFLSESVMIILSVLLALFINEWRNNHNEKKRTEIIMENIRQEVSTNRQFLETLIPYHESIRQNVQDAYNQDSLEAKFFANLGFEIFEVAPRGIIQGKFNNIAWDVAKQEKITNRISFVQAKELFEIYDQQETVRETIDRIITFISAREVHRKALIRESAFIFGTEIHELIGQEKNLKNRYDDYLQSRKE